MPELPTPDSTPNSSADVRLTVVPDGRRAPVPYGPSTEAIDGAGVHLLDYVRVLHKRRRTALTVFLLVVGGVTVYTFTATPIFEAKTRLLIEAEERNVVNFKSV